MANTCTYSKEVVDLIRTKAQSGKPPIVGFGARRKLPNFDDLTFLPAALSRLVIDAHKEACNSKTILGARNAKNPLVLDTPVLIAPMSFGAVSRDTKKALAMASTLAGTAASTGEGGMLPEERELAKTLFYQCTPGRYGFDPRDLKRCDCIELYLSQGAKPGVGGQLRAAKITEEIASQRHLPVGIDLSSPSRHPDFMGPDDLVLKIQEFREATDYRIPVSLKIAAGRVREDVKIAAKVGADIIAIDGMQGGTGATPYTTLDNIGIPAMPAIIQARQALAEMGLEEEVDIVLLGGIRDGGDVAKALALGAKAVGIGTAALISMGCIACLQCQTGKCPAGLATQDPKFKEKLHMEEAAENCARFIRAITEEACMIARATGKMDLHSLEPEDLRALTTEASYITGLPLIGSDEVYRGERHSLSRF